MFTSQEISEATQSKQVGLESTMTFSGVSQNSKTIKPEEIFIAIQGERFDGHTFLDNVFQRGVRAAIVKSGHVKKKYAKQLLFEVADTTQALGDLAQYHRCKFEIPVIGVTGSNGKTTTKELISELLATKFKVLKTLGNQNNLIGLPFTLFGLTSKHQVAVLELGMSLPFEIERLSEIASPQAGLITNIGDTHLETMSSREKIAAAKTALFRAMENEDAVFLNLDDPYLCPYHKKISSKVITYSVKDASADVFGKITQAKGLMGSDVSVTTRGKVLSFSFPLPGRHNVMNAVAAIAVADHFGVPLEEMKQPLSSFRAVAGRAQVIPLRKGIVLIDDCYNANPSSVRAALKMLEGTGATFAVLGDMLELGSDEKAFHEQIGEVVADSKIDNVLTYGPLSQYIIKGTQQRKNKLKTFWTLDQDELITQLKQQLISQSPAVVLVKGSRGMKMDRVVNALVKALGKES